MSGRPSRQRITESPTKQEGEDYQHVIIRRRWSAWTRQLHKKDSKREKKMSGSRIGRGVEDKGDTKFTIQ